jgi:hypothetical protein
MTQYIVDFLNSFIGLRKSIVMLSLMILTAIFRVKGYIGPDNFEGLLKATIVAYFGSNSVEHYTAMVKEKLTTQNKMVPVATIQTTTEEG